MAAVVAGKRVNETARAGDISRQYASKEVDAPGTRQEELTRRVQDKRAKAAKRSQNLELVKIA